MKTVKEYTDEVHNKLPLVAKVILEDRGVDLKNLVADVRTEAINEAIKVVYEFINDFDTELAILVVRLNALKEQNK